jgi:hypothetical protein
VARFTSHLSASFVLLCWRSDARSGLAFGRMRSRPQVVWLRGLALFLARCCRVGADFRWFAHLCEPFAEAGVQQHCRATCCLTSCATDLPRLFLAFVAQGRCHVDASRLNASSCDDKRSGWQPNSLGQAQAVSAPMTDQRELCDCRAPRFRTRRSVPSVVRLVHAVCAMLARGGLCSFSGLLLLLPFAMLARACCSAVALPLLCPCSALALPLLCPAPARRGPARPGLLVRARAQAPRRKGAALTSDTTLAKASTADAEVIVKRTLALCRYCAAAPHLPVRCQSFGGAEGSSV